MIMVAYPWDISSHARLRCEYNSIGKSHRLVDARLSSRVPHVIDKAFDIIPRVLGSLYCIESECYAGF